MRLLVASIALSLSLSEDAASPTLFSTGTLRRLDSETKLNLRGDTKLVSLHHESWQDKDCNDLFQEYDNIFPHHNRNAASHRWATFILKRAQTLTAAKLDYFFKSFCPVSGSPVTPNPNQQWHYSLETTSGTKEKGSIYHCCWPCVCDTLAWLKVDTKTVQTSEGSKQFNFLVYGNPCASKDPVIPADAPDVWCVGNQLAGATLSDHGYVIVGMLHQLGQDKSLGSDVFGSEVQHSCKARSQAGYQSGMGQIFIDVAKLNPVVVSSGTTSTSTSSIRALATTNAAAAAPPAPQPSQPHQIGVCKGDTRGDARCNHDSTHRVCAKIGEYKDGTGFWKFTGQRSWCQTSGDYGGLLGSKPRCPPSAPTWCICKWATARWIQGVGCENADIDCDATDVCNLKKSYTDAGVQLKVAHDCISKKCPSEWATC